MIVGKGAGFLGAPRRAGPFSRPTAVSCTFNSTPPASSASANSRHRELGTRLCDGRWHHVAVSYNGNQDLSGVAFYIDGNAQGLGADSNNLHAGSIGNDVHATIGATATRDGFYRGSLDEMQIFDRAITPADAARLYAGGVGR